MPTKVCKRRSASSAQGMRACRSTSTAPLCELVDIIPRVHTHLQPDITATSLNMAPGVPKPGPAKLGPRAGLDEWLEQAKLCRYLPEGAMKQLCEMVKECLMEGAFNFRSFVTSTLTSLRRVQHPTCPYTRHNLWRHPRAILRPSRALPRCWWYARRDKCTSSYYSY
jgi:hypothetical protein